MMNTNTTTNDIINNSATNSNANTNDSELKLYAASIHGSFPDFHLFGEAPLLCLISSCCCRSTGLLNCQSFLLFGLFA